MNHPVWQFWLLVFQ